MSAAVFGLWYELRGWPPCSCWPSTSGTPTCQASLVAGSGDAVMALVGYSMLLREYFLIKTTQKRFTNQ
jgi:hypothetical protein